MKPASTYEIQFSGLGTGKHEFHWTLEPAFFDDRNGEGITKCDLTAAVQMEKNDRMLSFVFNISGKIQTVCDHCGDELWLNVESSEELIAKFGSETDLSGDEVVVLGPNEFKFDVSQYIFEFTVLSIPARRIHKKGECNPEAEQYFEQAESIEENKENDPRWKALETLKNKQ